jgi:hypothetical protein
MRQLTVLFLFLLFSSTALAEDDVQLRHLKSALDAIRQEQQSVYQQFQMTEVLHQAEMQSVETGSSSVYVPEGQAPSYADAVRAKQDRQDRLKYYSDELRRLLTRYRDLGNEGASFVEQIRNLAQTAR